MTREEEDGPGLTLEEAHRQSEEGIAKIKRLWGVGHDTACLMWLGLSLNNLVLEQNAMMEQFEPGDLRPPPVDGDEWKDED